MTARKVKVFSYPDAPEHDGLCLEFSDVLPFSKAGMEKWAVPTGPDEAELFWCGQLTDRKAGAFADSSLRYLEGNEKRHIVDVDGDWGGMELPGWLGRVTITVRNALHTKHSDWSVYATPGASMLMLDLVKRPREYTPPRWHGFYFRGRIDWQFRMREKVFLALQATAVPHSFNIEQHSFMFPHSSALGPYTEQMQRESMDRYETEMLNWSMALCPRAGSHFTMRFYEACALGRFPVVIGDNIWLAHDKVSAVTMSGDANQENIARGLNDIMHKIPPGLAVEGGRRARWYFNNYVKPYFDDPTAAFISWLREKKIID